MVKYVGESIVRKDAREKVTGQAIFTFDIDNIPNMLFGKFLASPVAHAKIISIDTTEAETIPGVVTIVTGKDWPVKIGLYAGDRDILAVEKVTWIGQPIAAVAAESEEIAEKALESIKVEYDILTPILDPIEAKSSCRLAIPVQGK